jgi:hypothetical protein
MNIRPDHDTIHSGRNRKKCDQALCKCPIGIDIASAITRVQKLLAFRIRWVGRDDFERGCEEIFDIPEELNPSSATQSAQIIHRYRRKIKS